MKLLWHLYVLLFCVNLSLGAPPVQVDFMTSQDSEVIVYWFHPDVHRYEHTVDSGGTELNLVPGDESGSYAIASRITFPPLSCVENIFLKINQGDLYPGLPGDQYSRFGYSVYPDDDDHVCPSSIPLVSGLNALCGGNPCADEWVQNEILLPNPTGDALWMVFQWADSTPTAPQLKGRTPVPDDVLNVYGMLDGDTYRWNIFSYIPIFRLNLLTMSELDASWTMKLRPAATALPPDGFQIVSFTGNMPVDTAFLFDIDTLMYSLPVGDPDSVQIASVCGSFREDGFASAAFSPDKIIPLVPEVFPIAFGNDYTDMRLVATNISDDSLKLSIAFSNEITSAMADRIEVGGHETFALGFRVSIAPDDAGRAQLILQDRFHRYYPQMISVTFPDSGQTDIDDTAVDRNISSIHLSLYPNPSRGAVSISVSGITRMTVVDIFNILGQRVASTPVSPGNPAVWDSRGVPTGVYFVRLRTETGCVTERVLLMKR